MEKTACGGGGDDPDPFLLLPEEVLIQILVRLPIKSLLRFKSVCKSWRALIQTSYFIDLHSATTFNSSSSSNFGTFILRTGNYSSENVILMLSEYEGSHEYGDWYRCSDGSWHKLTTGGDGDDQLLLKLDNLELPSCYKLLTYSKVVIAGSCNGLVCLRDSKLRDVTLWNPATRQFRILPKSITIEIDDDDFVPLDIDFVAFGFDVKTKDYKVLLITRFRRAKGRPTNFFCRHQVYNLSTDSWRLLEGINYHPLALPGKHHGLYLNGTCFFIANVYHPESDCVISMFINSFDFTKEIFTAMQLPLFAGRVRRHRQDLFLHCLGGEKIALFRTLRKTSSGRYEDPNDDDDEYGYGYEDCDIWVLNDRAGAGAGVNKESWTKLDTFQIKDSRRGLPIGISNNGKFAFLETTEVSYRSRIRLYNLVTKQVKLDIPFSVSRSKVYVYKPSLVSIFQSSVEMAAAASSPAIG